MSAKPDRQDLPAYVSWKFFINFINGLRETHLPLQIDKSLMRTASGSQQSAMLAALRFLSLTDENGTPTAFMKQLVEASDEQRPALIKQMLEASYTFLFGDEHFPLEKASGQQVIQKFREQELGGSTIAKALAFFLAAAKSGNIKVSPHVKAPTISKTTGSGKRTARRDDTDGYEEDEEEEESLDVQRFQIPIPGKPSAVFTIPTDLEDDDWEMLKTMLDAYIARMRKQQSLA